MADEEHQSGREHHIEEEDLVDKDYPGKGDPAAEGTLGGGTPGGPDVPGEGRTEAIGGITGAVDQAPPAEKSEGTAEPTAEESDGGQAEEDIPGGPASGTGQNAEIDEEDVPDTQAEMPPGRKFGTPGITDGTSSD